MRTEINKEIESVSQTADPLKTLANADTMKLLGVQRPLLQVGHRARVLQGVQRPQLQVDTEPGFYRWSRGLQEEQSP